ncbi:hypothetical protein WR164_14800 [Philodulcilactobacillus myokoensis]|uniref:Uncharacterized protein n=1 Tax=Philodulcilactobacillus myokoensis TaxID=2929573 RepID=A0A9W6B2B3_9LACO|nr:hypothetical protein [Philodulcilactobacillus myokoensis]GLB47501.1 hypothetical protein WR164_14800 [Philodulcilactobacillus myokoensis]
MKRVLAINFNYHSIKQTLMKYLRTTISLVMVIGNIIGIVIITLIDRRFNINDLITASIWDDAIIILILFLDWLIEKKRR